MKKVTQAAWDEIAELKARLIEEEDYEAEEAQEEAAMQLGYDFYEVLDFLDALNS